MSFRALCNHTCDLYEIATTYSDGSPLTDFVKVNTIPVPCRLDLAFVKQGRDATWIEAAARASDRAGTMFFMPNAPIRSGMRAVITKGPKGTFHMQGDIGEIWDFDSLDHFECGVVEVSSLLNRTVHKNTSS